MQLQSVNIRQFRSIESCQLANCGTFNVLIGKNNSGKSNILLAINAFFTCLHKGGIVALIPPARNEIDFFGRNASSPIELTLTFSLSLTEKINLINDIIVELPQVKNAIDDNLSHDLDLIITICMSAPPNNFGYVSEIALIGSSKNTSPDSRKIIYYVDNAAALELFDRISHTDRYTKEIEAITELTKNRTFQNYISERRNPGSIRYVTRDIFKYGILEELLNNIESYYNKAKTPDEFWEFVETFKSERIRQVEEIENRPLKNKLVTFGGDAAAIPVYVHNLLLEISKIKILSLEDHRKPIGREEADRLLRLKVQRGGPEILRSIQETIEALLGVKVDAFESEEVEDLRRRKLGAELDVDNFLVEVNGSGIREALRLILDVEFEKPKILLVEEPEMHLHPALEISMMRFLKRISSECQVFVTTHSTNFLDTAEMKNVYLISKNHSTKVQHLNLEEAETQIPRELGIRLSSLFMFDRLVFVEGPSDEAVLREWAAILGKNLSQANVGFINMGGVRNFTHFATEATLSFLMKRQVKMWFILDRDEKDEDEIAKIIDRLGEKAVVKVLNKRELENYMLCSRALVDFIGMKKKVSGNPRLDGLPTEKQIQATLLECADDLKSFAIDKRITKEICKPRYLNIDFENDKQISVTDKIAAEIQKKIDDLEEAKKQIVTVYEEKTKLVDSEWQSDKLNIIPGDHLLDSACQKYGVRFRKERDGSQLAALMREQEIDSEIVEIITEIVS